MPTFSTKLVSRNEVAEGTMAFHFEKPPGFTFTPGQYVNVTLINPPETDAEGNTRSFSIASAPHDGTIEVVTRMRDTAFKRVLKTMALGTEVKMQGPVGMLTLPADVGVPVVFLTGGIGITPFLSMVSHATQTRSTQSMTLFYSNRRPEDTAYVKELQSWAKQNSHFRFVGTMTQMEKSTQPWSGEKGYITEEMVAKYVPDVRQPLYFIAGPPSMVENMVAMLRHAGVEEEKIRVEEFLGY